MFSPFFFFPVSEQSILVRGRLVFGELCFFVYLIFKIFCKLPLDGPLKYHKSQLLCFLSLFFFIVFLRATEMWDRSETS